VAHVVVDADGEVVFGGGLAKLIEDAFDHRWRELLRREPIAAADDGWHGCERQIAGILRQHSHDVLIERLAGPAGLLAAVENGDRLDRHRQSGQKRLAVEGPIEPYLDQAGLLALARHCIHGFLCGFRAGTHEHDHAFGVWRSIVVEKVIGAAGPRGKTIHHRLHYARHLHVERAACLPGLEKHVGILRRPADEWAIRREGVLAEGDQVLVVHHRANRLVGDGKNLAHFMRCAEAVEEMDERNARFQGGDLCDERQVGNLLHGIRGQHRPSRPAAGHHVGVVAEDRQCMGCQGASCNMHRRRGQLTGNLEHVGDHQQQPLRGRKCRSKGPGLQCAVQGAGRAALALQFFHNGQRAPDVLFPLRTPLIRPLAHWRRGSDGVDGDDFGKSVGNGGRSLVPIHNHSVQFTHSLRSTVPPLRKIGCYRESLLLRQLAAVMRGTGRAGNPTLWNDVYIVQRTVNGMTLAVVMPVVCSAHGAPARFATIFARSRLTHFSPWCIGIQDRKVDANLSERQPPGK
jgi:hypothetical protein